MAQTPQRAVQALSTCLVVWFAWCLPVVVSEEPNPEPTAQPSTTERLIKQLGSENYDEREAAQSRLKALGEVIRKELEAAAKGGDAEIAHGAKQVLKAINRARVEVKLVDKSEAPLAEVDVYLTLMDRTANGAMPQRKSVSAKTGKEGVAVFEGLDPREYYLVVGAQPAGYLPANMNKNNCALNVGTNSFTLSCSKGGVVKGVLKKKDGLPLANAKVVVCQSQWLRMREKTKDHFHMMVSRQRNIETDAAGTFNYEGLHEGEYFVAVLEEGKVSWVGPTVKVAREQTADVGTMTMEAEAAKDQKVQVAGEDQKKDKVKVEVGLQELP